MKSLSTPKLARRLRQKTEELRLISEELANRRVEVGISTASRFGYSGVMHNFVKVDHITRKETL